MVIVVVIVVVAASFFVFTFLSIHLMRRSAICRLLLSCMNMWLLPLMPMAGKMDVGHIATRPVDLRHLRDARRRRLHLRRHAIRLNVVIAFHDEDGDLLQDGDVGRGQSAEASGLELNDAATQMAMCRNWLATDAL